MSGGGAVALGSSVTLTNAGVTSVAAGTGISVSSSTGSITITNTSPASGIKGLGFGGETWHDVTGSRVSGSTYTAPIYPIMVLVTGSSSGSSGNHNLVVYISGSQITYTTQYAAGNDSPQIGFIVPPSATYKVDISGSGLSLGQWSELY